MRIKKITSSGLGFKCLGGCWELTYKDQLSVCHNYTELTTVHM